MDSATHCPTLRITLIAGVLAGATACVGAHGSPAVLRMRHECHVASETLRTGQPTERMTWALSLIRSCGPEGGRALAAAVRATRASTDSALLGYMRYQTGGFRDAAVFDALLEVAGDRGASDQARIYALLALEDWLRPELHFTYADVTTDIDENGVPQCARLGRSMSGKPQVTGTPLPADYKGRIGAVRNAIRRDTSGARLVRAAAACLF